MFVGLFTRNKDLVANLAVPYACHRVETFPKYTEDTVPYTCHRVETFPKYTVDTVTYTCHKVEIFPKIKIG